MTLSADYQYGSVTGSQSVAACERVLYHILTTSLVAFKEKPAYIDRIFRLLSPSERKILKRLVANRPLNVVHGYARRNMVLPTAAITVLDESEDMPFMGDHLGVEADSFDESNPLTEATVREIGGAVVQTRLQIHILDNHPDTVHHYYSICWALIRSSWTVFANLGMELTALNGSDLMPEQMLGPELVYARQLTLGVRGTRTYSVPVELIQRVLTTLTINAEIT